jgi:hypothetical protein
MAKVTGSRVAVDVTRNAIQVHGGYGFVRRLTADGKTNHLESIWRDSKVARSTRAPTRFKYGALRASRSDATSPADSRDQPMLLPPLT